MAACAVCRSKVLLLSHVTGHTCLTDVHFNVGYVTRSAVTVSWNLMESLIHIVACRAVLCYLLFMRVVT